MGGFKNVQFLKLSYIPMALAFSVESCIFWTDLFALNPYFVLLVL